MGNYYLEKHGKQIAVNQDWGMWNISLHTSIIYQEALEFSDHGLIVCFSWDFTLINAIIRRVSNVQIFFSLKNISNYFNLKHLKNTHFSMKFLKYPRI